MNKAGLVALLGSVPSAVFVYYVMFFSDSIDSSSFSTGFIAGLPIWMAMGFMWGVQRVYEKATGEPLDMEASKDVYDKILSRK